MAQIDSQTRVFTDPRTLIKKEIENTTTDKTIPDREKNAASGAHVLICRYKFQVQIMASLLTVVFTPHPLRLLRGNNSKLKAFGQTRAAGEPLLIIAAEAGDEELQHQWRD
jgi:hypothetical protein